MDRAAWKGILKQVSGIIIDELSSHGKVGLLRQGDTAQVRSNDALAQPTVHPAWPVIGAFAPAEVASLAKAPPDQKPGWRTFLRQYRGPMQIVLVAAGVISGVALRQWGTALVLLGLTLFNALIGLRQEGKAEASVAALHRQKDWCPAISSFLRPVPAFRRTAESSRRRLLKHEPMEVTL